MNSLAEVAPDIRVRGIHMDEDRLSVDLMDGRTVTVPLAWYPRLLNATPGQRRNWQIAGAGYGIHWPDIDEDLSTEGLLRGASAPGAAARSGRQPVRTVAPRHRGTNARLVEEMLQANAPLALRPAEIRRAIHRDKGVAIGFTSIRHALRQLEARRAAEQVGHSKTWRFIGRRPLTDG
jgi:Protein of unknown function (DUF2442)